MYRKTSIKTKFFFTSHGGYKISLNKCRTILYSRCAPKASLLKICCFTTHGGHKSFLKKAKQYFTQDVYQKTSLKIMLFYNSRWIQFFSKQMQNDTLLTAYTKKLLIKLSGFTTHGGYKIFPNKCRTILYSRCVLKNFY